MNHSEGSWRNVIIGCLLIWLFIQFGGNITGAATSVEQTAWIVQAQNGWIPDLNCWQLELKRTLPNGWEVKDHCAISKQEYDSHPIGSTYTAPDNLMNDNSDHKSHPA